jgi:hypothetical protein
MDSENEKIQTTVYLELEGKMRHAVSHKAVEEIEGIMQAEHLIPLDLDGEEIYVQAGCIEYMRKGDQRSKGGESAG